jgi:hypothetical protein
MELKGASGFPMIPEKLSKSLVLGNADRYIRVNSMQRRLASNVGAQTARIGSHAAAVIVQRGPDMVAWCPMHWRMRRWHPARRCTVLMPQSRADLVTDAREGV